MLELVVRIKSGVVFRGGPLEIPGGARGQKISSARIFFQSKLSAGFLFSTLWVFFWIVDCLQEFYF